MSRMKAMEQKLDSQQQAVASANSQSSAQLNSFQPRFSGGIGRGYIYNKDSQQNSRRSSNFRGGHRGDTSGRSANRRNAGTEGAQNLNL